MADEEEFDEAADEEPQRWRWDASWWYWWWRGWVGRDPEEPTEKETPDVAPEGEEAPAAPPEGEPPEDKPKEEGAEEEKPEKKEGEEEATEEGKKKEGEEEEEKPEEEVYCSVKIIQIIIISIAPLMLFYYRKDLIPH